MAGTSGKDQAVAYDAISPVNTSQRILLLLNASCTAFWHVVESGDSVLFQKPGGAYYLGGPLLSGMCGQTH